jgi:hypothetical protein
MIRLITGMWTSFHDLSDWNSKKKIAGQNILDTHQNLQRRISFGKTTCGDASSSPS